MEPTEEDYNNCYKWGIFYYNKKDPRLFVPKGPAGTYGLTFNFANKWSYVCVLILLGIVAWIIIAVSETGFAPAH